MLDRRVFLAGAATSLLGACTTSSLFVEPLSYIPADGMLVPPTKERFPVAPVNMANIPGQFHRQYVRDPTGEPPGTVLD